MKKILIDENSIFKIKIENKEDFSSSFFRDTYLSAAKIFNEIIKPDIERKKDAYEEINNIIAFAGERGEGKTSVMKSFAQSLQENTNDFKFIDEDEEKWAHILKREYQSIAQNKYEVLKPIDPSILREEDFIIEIIVAEMFKNFKDFKNNKCDCHEKRLGLMKKFQKVYKGLRILNGKKEDVYKEYEDDLEVLIDLTAGISLKSDLEDLIKGYLECIGKNVLVIAIDDLDMNIANGDKMLEDIRKYLLIHNVVILMAVKIEQMKDSVQQKYIKDFKELIEYNRKQNNYQKVEDVNVRFMANKYIEKIIPVERRLRLPKLNNSDVNEINININGESDRVTNIREIIKIKLFEKLNIIMLFDDQNDKLIPQTLRGIIDLLKILYSMEHIDEFNETVSNLRELDSEYLKNNIDIFRSYILKEWCDENIKGSHHEFLKEIDEIKPELANRRIVHHLGSEIVENLKDDEDKKDIRRDVRGRYIDRERQLLVYAKTISDREVNYENISIGEVNTCIYAYDKITFEEETKRFILALKILYTLKLLKLRYCEKDGEKRIKDVFAGDFFGEYFYISKNTFRNKFKVPLQIQNNSLKIKLNKKDIISIEGFEDNFGNNSEFVEEHDFMYLSINKVIEKLDTINKKQELTYIYSLIVPQFSWSLDNLFQRDKYYEYKILGVSSYYSNFYFKPLNILSSYIYLDDIKNRVMNTKFEQDNEINENAIDESFIGDGKLKDLIIDLVINQDLFMKITDKLDKELNKAKLTNIPIEIINNITKKLKLAIKTCLDDVNINGTNKLDIINDYKEFFDSCMYLNIDNYAEFINENIKIVEGTNSGYLGYYQEEIKEVKEIDHIVPIRKKITNADEDIYNILSKISDIQQYLGSDALKGKGPSVSGHINNKFNQIEKIINENDQLNNIKKIYLKYKKSIRDIRLEIRNTEPIDFKRDIKVDELRDIINKLREEIEKGA